jgi:F-type H+-transporting ATPase subunit epsilon
MRLKLLLPTRVLVDTAIQKLVGEAENGSFGLLPRHIDFTTALRPGILVYEAEDGTEHFVGIDEGILVKCRDEVLVSTRNAVPGTDLASLRETVRERYLELDEAEKLARSALARLEVGVVKRFTELRELR